MATLIKGRRVVTESPLSSKEKVVRLEPADDPAAVSLEGVTRVEVNFPKFGDGRGYSIAQLLRVRRGYRGELRAVGHITRDLLYYMERCGFDAFALRDEANTPLGQVRATKNAGNNHFVLVDTGFNELMRPSMYGSYHAMSVLRRDGSTAVEQPTVVAGPLCESGDVFTQGDGGVVLPRDLPAAQVGDLLVIHDTGAYGASMSSNYNTRPLIAEVLVDGGQARLIRRRQTVDELLALETGL